MTGSRGCTRRVQHKLAEPPGSVAANRCAASSPAMLSAVRIRVMPSDGCSACRLAQKPASPALGVMTTRLPAVMATPWPPRSASCCRPVGEITDDREHAGRGRIVLEHLGRHPAERLPGRRVQPPRLLVYRLLRLLDGEVPR